MLKLNTQKCPNVQIQATTSTTHPPLDPLEINQIIITRKSFRRLRLCLDRCQHLLFLPSVSRSPLFTNPIIARISIQTNCKGPWSTSCLSHCLMKIHARQLCLIVSAALVSEVLTNEFSRVWLPKARTTSNSSLWWVERAILGKHLVWAIGLIRSLNSGRVTLDLGGWCRYPFLTRTHLSS